MHSYSVNSDERFNVPFELALIAIGLAFLASLITGKFHPPFWLEVPGTATLYGLLLAFFRDYVWKWRWLHKSNLVKVPVIEGTWNGYVTSSFDNLAKEHPVKVCIRQNWTHFSVKLTACDSESDSFAGAIAIGDETIISYLYSNMPKTGATATMHGHKGTAVLRLSDDRKELTGEYYSGRDRANQGKIALRRS